MVCREIGSLVRLSLFTWKLKGKDFKQSGLKKKGALSSGWSLIRSSTALLAAKVPACGHSLNGCWCHFADMPDPSIISVMFELKNYGLHTCPCAEFHSQQ